MRVVVDRKRLSYPVVGKPDNVAHGPRLSCPCSILPGLREIVLRLFRIGMRVLWGIHRELVPCAGAVARTDVIAEKAAKCIYIPSLGQSLYFARPSASETFAAPQALIRPNSE